VASNAYLAIIRGGIFGGGRKEGTGQGADGGSAPPPMPNFGGDMK